jgi:hypothetical protein
MPVPDFSPGEVLTAAAMDSIGLWLVGSTTVTAQTTGVVDGCFSSNFRNYMMTVTVTNGTANQEISAQLRVGGSPAATNYNFVGFGAQPNGTASNGTGGGGTTSIALTFIPASLQATTSFFIGQPNIAVNTFFSGDWYYDDNSIAIGRRIIGQHKTATAYTGIQVFAASNWTGNIRIYGMRD